LGAAWVGMGCTAEEADMTGAGEMVVAAADVIVAY